jgi:H+/Cl- antiporter ClcA
MKLKSQVKPGKQPALAGMIVGIIMLLFGIVFLITIQDDLSHEDSSATIVNLFFGCWILVMLVIIFLNARSLSRTNAPSMLDIETESMDNTPEATFTIESKLKQLEQLKSEKLITEAEYTQKRDEIMQSKW